MQKSKRNWDSNSIISFQKEQNELESKAVSLESDLKESQFQLTVTKERVRYIQNEILQEDVEREAQILHQLQSENEELRVKESFLSKKLELNEQLKNIDLEELRILSKSNIVVNDTINQLISKWELIKTTRGPS